VHKPKNTRRIPRGAQSGAGYRAARTAFLRQLFMSWHGWRGSSVSEPPELHGELGARLNLNPSHPARPAGGTKLYL
jgi:hypothetical protein